MVGAFACWGVYEVRVHRSKESEMHIKMACLTGIASIAPLCTDHGMRLALEKDKAPPERGGGASQRLTRCRQAVIAARFVVSKCAPKLVLQASCPIGQADKSCANCLKNYHKSMVTLFMIRLQKRVDSRHRQ